MSQLAINLTSPVGRVVMGNLYKANDKDADGKPLVVKSGPNAGQPRIQYFFALAIPKNPGETHWSQTAWGKQIFAVGTQAFPNAAQSPAFAWKIEDGDSSIPNKKGRKPCDTEGCRGNWILKFSSSFAPKIFRQEGAGYVPEVTVDYVKPGYFVEVNFTVDGNGSQQQPGVYVNPNIVMFRAYGPEIISGPDVSACGFGQSPLPVGASTVPLAATAPLPVDNGFSAPTPTIPVIPNVAFAGIVTPPPPPPAAPVRQLTALAQGATYEQLIAGGWTDALLVSQGLMLP
jgi:hypothetical protein